MDKDDEPPPTLQVTAPGGPSADVYAGESVDPVREAMLKQETAANRAGPFAMGRSGSGGFFQPTVPSIVGKGPEELEKLLEENSTPTVQRVLMERIATSNELRKQAAEREQQQAQTEGIRAEAGLRQAQAADIGKTLADQLQEQGIAREQMEMFVRASPLFTQRVEMLMAEWAKAARDATPEQEAAARQAAEATAMGSLLQQELTTHQLFDPTYAAQLARATGLVPGSY